MSRFCPANQTLAFLAEKLANGVNGPRKLSTKPKPEETFHACISYFMAGFLFYTEDTDIGGFSINALFFP